MSRAKNFTERGVALVVLAGGLALAAPLTAGTPLTREAAGERAVRESLPRVILSGRCEIRGQSASGIGVEAPVPVRFQAWARSHPVPAAPGPIRVELKPTRRGLGTSGYMELAFPDSPFGVAVSADGRYEYGVELHLSGLRPRQGVKYVAWATTPSLDQVARLGDIGADGRLTARVDWIQFIVLVTAESASEGERWAGPILLTAPSPSGRMHTMAGHGIFEAHSILC